MLVVQREEGCIIILRSIEKKKTTTTTKKKTPTFQITSPFNSAELGIMQHTSSSPIQTSRYPSSYNQYPPVPILPSTSSSTSLLIPQYSSLNSPQSIKSIDATVFGPSIPPFKNSKPTNNSSSSSTSSSRSNDVNLRRLILFNLPVDLIREYLELYLEHLSGEAEIERIDYSNLEDTTVMVTFKTELGSCP